MRMLAQIPLIDLRGRSPVDLAREHRDEAEAMVVAASNTFGGASRLASALVLPWGDRASRAWLARTNNPYAGEIDAIAAILGRAGAHTLNVCFEWGCTSGVWRNADGALLRRVLDWPFPTLGESVVVARQDGPAGEFFNMTWPGANGIFHATAPGRFAAAINQAPSRRHGAGYVGDWFLSRLAAGRATGLPAAHLLRHVFETAKDYGEAKRLLCETPLAVPAIFILCGLDDGCVIERTEDDFAVREMAAGRVCATNHFETRLDGSGADWRARPIDSLGRAACANALDGAGEEFAWFRAPIANVNSRLVFTANPATGALALAGTAGEAQVTEIFRLAA
jgi:hypothetical protein